MSLVTTTIFTSVVTADVGVESIIKTSADLASIISNTTYVNYANGVITLQNLTFIDNGGIRFDDNDVKTALETLINGDILLTQATFNFKTCQFDSYVEESYLMRFTTLSDYMTKMIMDGCGFAGSFKNFFLGKTALKTISLENSIAGQLNGVSSLSGMFENCTMTETITLDNTNVNNVTDFSSMFKNCSVLTRLNISSWDTHAATTMLSFMNGTNSLKSITMPTVLYDDAGSGGIKYGSTLGSKYTFPVAKSGTVESGANTTVYFTPTVETTETLVTVIGTSYVEWKSDISTLVFSDIAFVNGANTVTFDDSSVKTAIQEKTNNAELASIIYKFVDCNFAFTSNIPDANNKLLRCS